MLVAAEAGFSSGFPEHHYPVRIGPLGVVIHAPAVGSFGELLIVDQNQHRFQAGSDAAREDRFFEFGFATMNFANFKGDVTARF